MEARHFIIIDKNNKIVHEVNSEKEAKYYVLKRPYLRYEEFILEESNDDNWGLPL